MSKRIADGFSTARAITKQHAKTFYFASHFLPEEKRPAAYAVYALCRISDDTVDAVSSSTAAAAKNLSRIQDSLNAVYDNSPLTDDLLIAFKQTVATYAIPRLYFDELIDGMYLDLNKHTYEDFDELYRYCYKVAGVVGLIMLKIFGSNNPAAETHAVQLGVAMQLTNILRDIREDFQRGRVYLPQNELEKFGLSSDRLSQWCCGCCLQIVYAVSDQPGTGLLCAVSSRHQHDRRPQITFCGVRHERPVCRNTFCN
jgi:phytoene synthase